MKNLICKTACTFFLMVLLTAFIGVNVRQLYCMHMHRTVWEVCLLPEAGMSGGNLCCGKGCCGGGCCEGNSCARPLQVLFYRLADCPEMETEVRVDVVPVLPLEPLAPVPVPLRAGEVCSLPPVPDVPSVPPEPQLLCVYRC